MLTNTTPNTLQSAQWQTAYALAENSRALITQATIERSAFLTLTFPKAKSPTEARKIMSAACPILNEHFEDWIYTIGLGGNGRIHYHVVAAYSENLREGSDPSLYPLLLELDPPEFHPLHLTKEEQRTRIREGLSSSPALKDLQKKLRAKLLPLGFGRQLDISPVLSNAEAAGNYMKNNYIDAIERRHPHAFKGIRVTGSRRGKPRVCRPPFAWRTAKLHRQAVAKVASALGGYNYEEMRPIFGPKWGYRITGLLGRLRLHYGQDPKNWPDSAIQEFALDDKMMPITEAA